MSIWLAALPVLAEASNRQFYANGDFEVTSLFDAGSERILDEDVKKVILHANHATYSSSRPGNVERGIEILSVALEISLPNASLLLERASLYGKISLENRAIKDLVRVLQIDPENKFVHYALGVLYLEQDRHQEAISALEIAIERMPDYNAPFQTITYALIEVGRFDDALATALRAGVYWREDDFRRGHPLHRETEGLIADIYCLAGQADKAIEVYQGMGELSPAFWKEKAKIIAKTKRVENSNSLFKTPPDVVMRRWINDECPGLLTEEAPNLEEKT